MTESTRLMLTRGKLTNGKTLNDGLGVFIRKVNGRKVIRHGGGISGFRADLAYSPDSEITIAALANRENLHAARLSDQIARRLFSNGDDGEAR